MERSQGEAGAHEQKVTASVARKGENWVLRAPSPHERLSR